MVKEEKLRSEIDDKYKWDLTGMYKSIDDFNSDYDKALKLIEEIKAFKGILTKDATTLYEYLKKDDELNVVLANLYVYVSCKLDEDMSNKASQKEHSKILNLYSLSDNALSFAMPELLNTNYEIIEKYIKENDALKEYRIDLERIYRNQPYVLSEKEEKLLSNISDLRFRFKNNFNIINNVLIDFGYIEDEDGNKVKLTNGNASKYAKSSNRKIRKQVFEKRGLAYQKLANLIATDYEGSIKADSMISRARGFKSNIEMYLFDDDVSVEIYDNLLRTAHDNISVLHKYYKLKKDILNLDELCSYDLSAPLVKESKEKYTPEDARKIICDALNVYGDEYVKKLNLLFDENCIDFYPNKGKKTGYYQNNSYKKIVVFCNYNDDFSSVSSLAHELGHAVHSYYSMKNNKEHLSNYSILVAEIASLTNEMLLSNYVVSTSSDKNLKLKAIENILEVFSDNFFGTLLLGSVFEKEVHEKICNGNVLEEEDFNSIYDNLMKEHNGKIVKGSVYQKYNWSRIPHFYTPFYYYKYSIGAVVSCYVARKILSGDKEFLNKYINFLKLGDRLMPLEELKTIGVDLSKPDTINEGIKYFDELISKFKEIYNS